MEDEVVIDFCSRKTLSLKSRQTDWLINYGKRDYLIPKRQTGSLRISWIVLIKVLLNLRSDFSLTGNWYLVK